MRVTHGAPVAAAAACAVAVMGSYALEGCPVADLAALRGRSSSTRWRTGPRQPFG